MRCIQIAHAAGESAPGDLPSDTHVVLLEAEDEASLAAIADRIEAQGLPLTRIHEDRAPYCGQLMSVGARPGRKEVVGRFFRGMPLLRPE